MTACAPDTLTFTVGYYQKLSNAITISELKECIHNEIRDLGFTDYSVIWFSSIGDETARQLSSFPADLVKFYYENRHYKHDLALQQAKISLNPFNASTLNNYIINAPFTTESNEVTKEISAMNRGCGFYDYYYMPTKSKMNAGNILLSVSARGTSPRVMAENSLASALELKSLCEAIDVVATRNFPEPFLTKIPEKTRINEKPLRVLQALANNDFTIGQTANALNISVVTANKHLETVRRSLRVRTNYAAIKIGLQQGLIQYESVNSGREHNHVNFNASNR